MLPLSLSIILFVQQAAKQTGQQSSHAGSTQEGAQPEHPGGGQVQGAGRRECHPQVSSSWPLQPLILG